MSTCFTKFFESEDTSNPQTTSKSKKPKGKSKASKAIDEDTNILLDANNSRRKVEFEEYNFCHHCKQFKVTYIMSKCRYSFRKNGVYHPVQSIINNVMLPNVEPHLTPLINILLMRKLNKDKKKQRLYEHSVQYSC